MVQKYCDVVLRMAGLAHSKINQNHSALVS